MSLREKAKKHRVSIVLYIAFCLFFLISSMVSVNTYSAVVKAQKDIVLQNPHATVSILPDWSMKFTFSIELKNPSRYVLHAEFVSWAVKLENQSSQTEMVISLATDYSGPTAGVRALDHSVKNFSYTAVVSNPATIAKLNGFIAYSSAQGEQYTLTTLPYSNNFDVMMTIGEFKNDYLREAYLNQLVTIELSYPEESA